MTRSDGYPDSVVHTLGTCPVCGKVRYGSRADAKRTARSKGWRGMNAYQCGEFYHLGHLPAAVKTGDITRDDLRRPA